MADVGYGHSHSSGHPAFRDYTHYSYFFFRFLTQSNMCTHTHTHIPQRPNQPSPPPLSLWVFLRHLILAVCMWIIHHSLNQSIEFHLVRCYTGHVIDSLVPFHWSLNDTQCCLGDVRARTDTRMHAYTARSHPAALGLRCQGGRVGCRRCQRRPPLRLSQGRRVQLAVPTSVQSGLKTGMKEACRCCLTLDLSH